MEDANKWKDILFSSIVRVNIVKIPMLLKAIYKFNAIPIKVQMAFFKEVFLNCNIFMEPQKSPHNKANLIENKVRGITISDFKLYHKAIVTKTVW